MIDVSATAATFGWMTASCFMMMWVISLKFFDDIHRGKLDLNLHFMGFATINLMELCLMGYIGFSLAAKLGA